MKGKAVIALIAASYATKIESKAEYNFMLRYLYNEYVELANAEIDQMEREVEQLRRDKLLMCIGLWHMPNHVFPRVGETYTHRFAGETYTTTST